MAAPEEHSTTAPGGFHSLDQFSNDWYDRGAPRWKEILWRVVSYLWFEGNMPLPSAWRVFWLRAFGANVGRHVVIRSKVTITMPWRLSLGDHVWIGEEVFILSLGEVTVGPHSVISQRAFLCCGSHDIRRTDFQLRQRPIHIGREVWIAAQAFVGEGIKIGDGTVVAAGSVVTQNLPAGVIARGNPAVVTGLRKP